jgi:hypothetical protein
MRRRPPAKFRVVAVEEAVVATGLRLPRLLAVEGVEELSRVLPDGRRERAVRLPVELLPAPVVVPPPARGSRRKELLEQVAAVLEAIGGPTRRQELADRVGLDGSDSTLTRALEYGVEAGLLGREHRGRTVVYWLMPTSTRSEE